MKKKIAVVALLVAMATVTMAKDQPVYSHEAAGFEMFIEWGKSVWEFMKRTPHM